MERETYFPNKYEQLKQEHDAALEKQKRETDKKPDQEPGYAIDATEARKAVHLQELQAKHQAGRISARERVDEERRFDNRLLVDENARQQAQKRGPQEAQKPEAIHDLRSDNAQLVVENAKRQAQQRSQQEAQKQVVESEPQPEPEPEQENQTHHWTNRGGMVSQQASAREALKKGQRSAGQEQEPDQPERQAESQRETPADAPTPVKSPEKSQADWRRLLNDPDYRRQVEAPTLEVKEPGREQEASQQPRPAGDQPEKKDEEKEVDWRRLLTDPDYRREVKRRDREAGQEKITQQECQEQGQQRVPSGRER